MRSGTYAAFTLACLTGSARAEDPRAAQPVLPNVLSTKVGGSFEARVDYTDLGDSSLFQGLRFISLTLQAQKITPSGVGGYVSVPLGFIDADGVDSQNALGNVELGGVYVIRNASLDIYLRAGFSVETADDEGDLIVPLSNIVSRPADAFTTGLNTSWARAHGGLRYHSGALVIGGQGGVDIPLDRDDADEVGLLVIVGSIGISQPGFGIAAGITYLQLFGDNVDNSDNETFSANLAADFEVGRTARVFGVFGANLEDEFDGFSIGGGVRVGF